MTLQPAHPIKMSSQRFCLAAKKEGTSSQNLSEFDWEKKSGTGTKATVQEEQKQYCRARSGMVGNSASNLKVHILHNF